MAPSPTHSIRITPGAKIIDGGVCSCKKDFFGAKLP
jgi:hypothetical protein